jgi:hypothetical protein
MKHLKLLPLLIAAAYCMPRLAHAAEAAQQESSSYGAMLICIGLVVLAAAGRGRAPSFKHEI